MDVWMGKRDEERLEKRKEIELGAFSGRVPSNESWGLGDLHRWAWKREKGHERVCQTDVRKSARFSECPFFISFPFFVAFLDLYYNQRLGMCMYMLGEMGTGKTG